MSFLEKTDDIEISNKSPFLNCKLERKPIADNLTKIIEGTNCKKGFVFGIDSPWGTGKTTFIKMWEKQLRLEKSEDIFTIYFNAWENDFHGEVLPALIGELDKHLDDVKNANKKDLVKVEKSIVGDLALNLVKSKTLGVLDLKKIYNELEGSEKRELFNQYQKYKEIKENIQKDLVKIKNKLNVGKVIFFIDELDRCRPDYAIETLEKIKHLFGVEGYIFVLSLDKEQLSHSVSTIYGNGMDSEGYLRRFIDLDYSLPKPDEEKYIELLKIKLNLIAPNENDKYFWEFLIKLTMKYSLSLRDIDKLFYQLQVLLPLISLWNDKKSTFKASYKYTLNLLYSLFLILKLKDKTKFNKIINGDITLEEFKDLKPKKNWDASNSLHNEIIVKMSKLLKNPKSLSSVDEESTIGKEYGERESFDLCLLFENNKFTIKETLDFIGDFDFRI